MLTQRANCLVTGGSQHELTLISCYCHHFQLCYRKLVHSITTWLAHLLWYLYWDSITKRRKFELKWLRGGVKQLPVTWPCWAEIIVKAANSNWQCFFFFFKCLTHILWKPQTVTMILFLGLPWLSLQDVLVSFLLFLLFYKFLTETVFTEKKKTKHIFLVNLKAVLLRDW